MFQPSEFQLHQAYGRPASSLQSVLEICQTKCLLCNNVKTRLDFTSSFALYMFQSRSYSKSLLVDNVKPMQ